MPTIANFSAAAAFAENAVNGLPALLDTDVEFLAPAGMANGALTVHRLLAEDRISILSQGDGAGQIGFDGGAVRYGGETIGTATGGLGGTFTVAFNAAATEAAVDALIQSLTYANVSNAPTLARTLTLDVIDQAGAHLNAPTVPSFVRLDRDPGPGPVPPGFDYNSPFSAVRPGPFASPSFMDLDGDGRLDLVIGGDFDLVLAYRNTPAGFTPITGAADPFSGIRVPGMVSTFVDLDGDGRLDMVAGDSNGTVRAWRNTGTGANAAFTELDGLDGRGVNPFAGIRGFGGGEKAGDTGGAPVFMDLDGDGLQDLVLGLWSGLSAWRNSGTATNPVFTAMDGQDGRPASPLPQNFFGYTALKPAVIDMDRDGLLDLLVAGSSSTGTYVYFRNIGTAGEAAFAYSPIVPAQNSGLLSLFATVGRPNSPTFVDLNDDGLLDMVHLPNTGLLPTLRSYLNTTAVPSITVTVAAENEAPVVTSAVTGRFAENATGLVYQATAAADPDGPFTITWTLGGTDAALFTLTAAGALSFTAAGGPNFEAPADAGGDNVYDLVLTASDGTATTDHALTITVTNVRETASFAGLRATAYFAESTVNTAPQLLDSDVVFTSDETLNAGSLSVSGLLAEDRVTIRTQGDGAGQIGFDGTTIRFGGSVIGTASGGTGTTFTVTFGPNASPAAADALIQRLAYGNASDTPTESRTLAIEARDAGGVLLTATPSASILVTVLPVDDAPAGPVSVTLAAQHVNATRLLVAADLLAGWADPEGEALTVSDLAVISARPGLLVDLGAGRWSFHAALGDDTDIVLAYTVSDGAMTARVNAAFDLIPNSRPTGALVIGAEAGVLSVTSTLADADGLGPISLDWNMSSDGGASWQDIPGAHAASFIPGAEAAGQWLRAMASYTDGAGTFEAIASAQVRIGTAAADRWTASAATPVILGGDGDDLLSAAASAGAVMLAGDAGNDTLRGGSGDDTLLGSIGQDRLVGGGGLDSLSGGDGNDTLDGGADADTLSGGAGDDTYVVDNANDRVVEAAGEGYDRVIASVNWVLDAETERLNLVGTANLNGTGNALTNRLDGNAGANVLDGGDGNDTLYGGMGNDTLVGGLGTDRLDGGLGADRMEGGAGDDLYYVDDALDVVVEQALGGYDRVIASINHALVAEVERLSLSGIADLNGAGNSLGNRLDGNGGANTLDGGEGNDLLYGGLASDTLIGGGGNDWMDGGVGADSLTGGTGADIFYFRSATDAGGDVITDFNAGEGDRIDLRPIDANLAALGNQGFTWIGGALFGGVAGQLRFASGTLQGDVTGDGMADFEIGMSGVASLTSTSVWL